MRMSLWLNGGRIAAVAASIAGLQASTCSDGYAAALAKMDAAIQTQMLQLNVVGAGVAVYRKGSHSEPFVRGYGSTKKVGPPSAPTEKGTAVTKDTVFLLASISKVFTGAALSKLVDQGKVKLDDDIKDTVPAGWAKSTYRNPKHSSTPITWRMLATHRSSMKDIPDARTKAKGGLLQAQYGPNGGYLGAAVGNPTCPLTDMVGFFRDILENKKTETIVGSTYTPSGGGPLNWYALAQAGGGSYFSNAPGNKVEYSNMGSGYLGMLVGLKAGKPFDQFCKDQIFAPLGMKDTAWFVRDLPGRVIASPITYASGKYIDVGHYCFIDYPSGQLRSSASDMAKWGLSLLDYGAPALWTEPIGKMNFACQERRKNGQTPSYCQYGIAWEIYGQADKSDRDLKGEGYEHVDAVRGYDWTDMVMHSGGEKGAQTQILVMPKAGIFAVVLTNTDGNDYYAAQKIMSTLIRNMPGKCVNGSYATNTLDTTQGSSTGSSTSRAVGNVAGVTVGAGNAIVALVVVFCSVFVQL